MVPWALYMWYSDPIIPLCGPIIPKDRREIQVLPCVSLTNLLAYGSALSNECVHCKPLKQKDIENDVPWAMQGNHIALEYVHKKKPWA